MAWRVGMKVVCVDDLERDQFVGVYSNHPAIGGLDGLRKNSIYTVRAIAVERDGEAVLFLNEITRSYCPTERREAAFSAWRFRPVVEREYDISIFTAMLSPAKKAAETVGFLAFMGMIMWGIQLLDFVMGQ